MAHQQSGGPHARLALVGAGATGTQTVQEQPLITSPVAAAPRTETTAVTLVLRPRKKVSWNVETVDNEHMQKKSSKICCVFHKKESLEDSDDEHEHDDEGGGCGGSKGKGKHPCTHRPADSGESSEKPAAE